MQRPGENAWGADSQPAGHCIPESFPLYRLGEDSPPCPTPTRKSGARHQELLGPPGAGRSDINLLGGDLFAVQRRGALGRRADGAQGWGANQGEVPQLATDTDETGRNFNSAVTGC